VTEPTGYHCSATIVRGATRDVFSSSEGRRDAIDIPAEHDLIPQLIYTYIDR